MANFDIFLQVLLPLEGGFVNDPADPGGATNKGITLKTFQACAQSLLSLDPTLDNLKSLTDAQVGVIYRALYWNNTRGDDTASQNLANIVCDFYVNSGTPATKLLQTILSAMGHPLTVDGAIGPASIQALQAVDQDEVYRQYKQGRKQFYQDLAQKKPALAKFLKGWINRVNSFPDV